MAAKTAAPDHRASRERLGSSREWPRDRKIGGARDASVYLFSVSNVRLTTTTTTTDSCAQLITVVHAFFDTGSFVRGSPYRIRPFAAHDKKKKKRKKTRAVLPNRTTNERNNVRGDVRPTT